MTDEATPIENTAATAPVLSTRDIEMAGLSAEEQAAYEQLMAAEAAGTTGDDDDAPPEGEATAAAVPDDAPPADAPPAVDADAVPPVDAAVSPEAPAASVVETTPAVEPAAAAFEQPVPVPRAVPAIDAAAMNAEVDAANEALLQAAAKFDAGEITAEELAREQIAANKRLHTAQRQIDRYEDAVEEQQAAINTAQAALNAAFERFAKTDAGKAFVNTPAMYAALSAELVRRQQAGQIFGRQMSAVLDESVQSVREQIAQALGIALPTAPAPAPQAPAAAPARRRATPPPGGPKVLADVPAAAPNVDVSDEWSKYRAMDPVDLEFEMTRWPQSKINAFLAADAKRYG